jgi:hypothetical protein
MALLLPEEPHVFAVLLQVGVYFLRKVASLVDNHSKFASGQPSRRNDSNQNQMRENKRNISVRVLQ